MTINKRLSNDDLTAIRERAEKATEGAWVAEEIWTNDFNIYPKGSSGYIAKVNGDSPFLEGIKTNGESDAAFIAHARQDIPKLLAEIERLNGLYEDMTSIAKWSTRRLHETHKDFAYGEIETNLGREVDRV